MLNSPKPPPPSAAALAKLSLAKLSPTDQAQLALIIAELKRRRHQDLCRKSFISFVKHIWPEFISGRHHARIAHEFEALEAEADSRLIINLAPRHTKSEFASVLLPAWYLGNHPEHKVIQCSVTAELAVGFGRRVRNMIASPKYKEIFPHVSLQIDSKAAGRWATNLSGQYYAIGVSGSVTGIGADLLIIDDPHDEQQALQAISSPEIYDKIYEWYQSGPRQRLQPQGSIIIVMTRWSKRDLTAQLLKKAALGGEQWKTIVFPAILPSGNPLWPEFWTLDALSATRTAIALPKWNAQYMQSPTSEEGALVKRSDWQRWPHEAPPSIDFILQTMDTAFEKSSRADYSAILTWGVFLMDDPQTGAQQSNIILLDMVKERCEFPRLKQLVLEKYREYNADKLIIEKKATGAPLIYELRAAGVPCSEFTPTRATGDKIARLHAVTDVFASKRVWAPNRRFADEVIEEVAGFPNSEHDDLVDCTSMALAYFRQGGFIQSALDAPEETQYFKSNRHAGYY